MNLLTEIKIKGEIFLEYSFISYEFSFENNAKEPLSAEYYFSLPQDCVVSSMKIIKPNGTVISTAVVSLSHASAIWSSSNSAILRKVDKTTYRLNLDGISSGTCRVIIHIYAPLIRCGNRRRLTIPHRNISTKIEFFVRGVNADKVTATHNAVKTAKADGVLITTDNINGDNDFAITVTDEKTYNSAIAVQNLSDGEMLCRVYCEKNKDMPVAGKQFVGAIHESPETKLKNFNDLIADPCSAMPTAGGDEKIFQFLYPQSVGNDLCVVPCGKGEAIRAVHIISHSPNNITLYIKYHGELPPSQFEIEYQGERIKIHLERAEIYKSFAPIKLVCAEVFYQKLCRRLELCTPAEVQGIKAEMEQIGVKYSALNTETALAAVVESGIPSAVRVVICEPSSENNMPNINDNVVKEDNAVISLCAAKAAFDMCIDIIIKSMHANGGIFAYGELNPAEQKKQTLVCVLALSASGLLEKYGDFAEKAIAFLDGYSYNGLCFTDSCDKARHMLSGIFPQEPAVLIKNPDLLTAARFIFQTK